MSSLLPRAPRTANPTHPEFMAHRVWVPVVPQGIDEQAERVRLQNIHNAFLAAFENGKIKLPGFAYQSSNRLAHRDSAEAAYDLSSLQASVCWQEKKRTPIDFITASSQVKASANDATATIHLLISEHDDIRGDLGWLYQEAYLALRPGGWLMQLQLHQQPQAHAVRMPASASTDPVKATLQNEGFINPSLSVAHASAPRSIGTKGVDTKVPATETCEMRVWVAQKPRIYSV